MAARDPDAGPPPRLFALVPASTGPSPRAASEPIVLAMLVAEALEAANLSRAVLEMRESPAGWVSFLVELDSLLREGSA